VKRILPWRLRVTVSRQGARKRRSRRRRGKKECPPQVLWAILLQPRLRNPCSRARQGSSSSSSKGLQLMHLVCLARTAAAAAAAAVQARRWLQ
jgi:hypothetical protein